MLTQAQSGQVYLWHMASRTHGYLILISSSPSYFSRYPFTVRLHARLGPVADQSATDVDLVGCSLVVARALVAVLAVNSVVFSGPLDPYSYGSGGGWGISTGSLQS